MPDITAGRPTATTNPTHKLGQRQHRLSERQTALILEVIAGHALTIREYADEMNERYCPTTGNAFHHVSMMASLIGALADTYSGHQVAGDIADWTVGPFFNSERTQEKLSRAVAPRAREGAVA